MKNLFQLSLIGFLIMSNSLFAQSTKQKNNQDINAEFDAYAQKAVKDWNIPGLAIVVVKNNQVVFKKTYWYAMAVSGKPDLIPQAEEDITEACWLSKNKLDEVQSNSYPLILDLVNEQFK
jgi:hypothetical protein